MSNPHGIITWLLANLITLLKIHAQIYPLSFINALTVPAIP